MLHETSGSGSDLIYVSTAKGIVYLTYPGMKVLGTLPTGYEYAGLCSDPNNGNVYVPEGNDVVVYAHGGTTPIATLTPPSGYQELFACSVDPNTGNLAVSASTGSLKGTGAILIYPGGQGSATIYSDKRVSFYGYPAYDDSGDIFFNADKKGSEQIVKLNVAKNSFIGIKFDSSFGSDKIQWDGKYLDLEQFYGRGRGSQIFQIQINGDVATVANQINLYDAGTPSSFWVSKGILVNTLVQIESGNNRGVGAWSYPLGGEPTAKPFGIAKGKNDYITDVTISVPPSR